MRILLNTLMKISFCSQVCNRFSQISATLLHNLSILTDTPHNIVLVVYASTDGTSEYVRTIRHPNLTVIHCNDQYDIIAAKNLAHYSADGDYLFNLDIDNFISTKLVQYITDNNTRVIHNWTSDYNDGTYGRIGAPRNKFLGVGGYPAYMQGAALHDEILLKNLEAYGPILHYSTVSRLAIRNTKAETVANLVPTQSWENFRVRNLYRYLNQPICVAAMRVTLLKNSYGTKFGHLVNVAMNARRSNVTMKYCVTFDSNFKFGLGGKLPGLGAGACPTGGIKSTHGWSVRPMWRQDGQAEFYIYRPNQLGKFGDSLVLPIKFQPGKTHTIELSHSDKHMTMRIDDNALTIKLKEFPTTMLYHVFRGGNSPEWSSDQTCSIDIHSAEAK